MNAVPILHADRLDAAVRYRLEAPERDAHEPLLEEFIQVIDQASVAALVAGADGLLRSPETSSFAREARTRGSVLYRALVPEGLRVQLKRVSGALLVSTSLHGVPWELLHDDEEFWGIRYALGKRLVLPGPFRTGAEPARRVPPRALVIGSDPRGDLPFVHEEVERVTALLERFADTCCVSGPLATFAAVTDYLRDGFDVVHYCGHVVVDRDGGPALLLADHTPLSARVIESTLTGRPLVFLNGCASVRGAAREPSGAWEERSASVAQAFLYGGALAVIGTLCEVSDRHAATLASGFYEEVMAPRPVGEALRRARAQCRADGATAPSPTWLSFVLYGNPAQALLGPRARPVSSPLPGRREGELPTTPAAPARHGRRWFLTAAAASVLGVALWLAAGRWARNVRPAPVVVGVMEVRPRGHDVPEWMPAVIRDGLNTILSKAPGVQAYSSQKIDFLRETRRLSEIEVAETLGMSKMIAATVAVFTPIARLEVQIVDIATGILEATEQVEGPVGQLIELQNELALKTLRALHVAATDAELRDIFAKRTNETLESYRLLAETLGAGGDAPATPRAPAPPPGSWRHLGSVAFAQEPGADQLAIRDLLERYRQALQTKDEAAVMGVQTATTAEQRDAQARYFAHAQNLSVRISEVEVLVEGDDALATFTREDVFTDARSGRPLNLEIRVSARLSREAGGWRIRSFQKQP